MPTYNRSSDIDTLEGQQRFWDEAGLNVTPDPQAARRAFNMWLFGNPIPVQIEIIRVLQEAREKGQQRAAL